MSDTLDTLDTVETIPLGAPVYDRGRRGFVTAVTEANGRQVLLSNMSRRISQNVEVVWESGGISPDIPDSMAAGWIDEARRIGMDDVLNHAELRAAARAARTDAHTAAQEQRAREAEARKAWVADAAGKIPPGSKAVIYAEFERDDSDSMTDYFNTKTERVLILGFSTHDRDLFPELRKAALNNPETAALADAPDGAEHREKYSMGAGYYLKAGSRYSTGWAVRKRSISRGAEDIPSGEWSIAAPAPEGAPAVTVAGAIRIEKHVHTKKGFDMWICILGDRVERDEFDRLRSAAEALGGWYSRPWGRTPGGFAFKSEADAQAFANPAPSPTPDGGAPSPDAPAPTPGPVTPRPGMGDKLRDLADRMAGEIAGKFADRLTNTPKRQREAGHARQEGGRLERTQAGLRALADLHDAGTVPPDLRAVTSKAAAYALAGSHIDRSNAGYYDSGFDTGKPSLATPAALAFWALLAPPDAEAVRREALRRKVEALAFANIPGYFPTPPEVVARLIEAARLPDGPATILEPEAGGGGILDPLRAAAPAADFIVYERQSSLREILTLKGYDLAGADFLEAVPEPVADRVLMNPPFEHGQDIDHVRHAFAFLKPSGRLVAIMSPGAFFRQDRRAVEFRDWFEGMGGEREELPPGSFKASGTGVGAVMVTLDREG